jgi:hypothetical protein
MRSDPPFETNPGKPSTKEGMGQNCGRGEGRSTSPNTFKNMGFTAHFASMKPILPGQKTGYPEGKIPERNLS